MIPSPSDLNYFNEIARTGNISRAAERLGISQPTLSLAVRRLEDSVGVSLLLRSKTGVRLTHAGQRLQRQTQALLLEWDRIRTDAVRAETEIRGRYTLGCHVSVGLYCLPQFIPMLLSENSNLELTLIHDLSRKIAEDVISFKIDFGLVVNPWEHPDLVIKELCRDEVTFYTIAKPTPLQNPTSGEGVLICHPELHQTQDLLKQMAKRGFHFKRMMTSPNLEMITELVASGAGVGILPGRVATRQKSLGLRPVRKKGTPVYIDKHCLVYRADAQKSPASRALARWILARPVWQS